MEEPILNAIVTLRNEVSPWLMILQVVPDGWDLPEYIPGNFTAIGLPGSATRCAMAEPELFPADPDNLMMRAYCIASSPANREFFEFYIALVPGRYTVAPFVQPKNRATVTSCRNSIVKYLPALYNIAYSDSVISSN